MMMEGPTRGNTGIFNPDAVIILIEIHTGPGVLNKNFLSGFHLFVPDFALILLQIMDGARRSEQILIASKMIKTSLINRKNPYGKRFRIMVVYAASFSKIRIQIIKTRHPVHKLLRIPIPTTQIKQKLGGSVRKQPDSGIKQIDIIAGKCLQGFCGRFLQHGCESGGIVSWANEDPVFGSNFGLGPNANTNYVSQIPHSSYGELLSPSLSSL
jgi:hypothetical protein